MSHLKIKRNIITLCILYAGSSDVYALYTNYMYYLSLYLCP